MQEIKIEAQESDQRLDKYLKKYLPSAGSGFIYKMLRKKNIVLNGKKADGCEKLQAGDAIQLYLADETIKKFHSFANETPENFKDNAKEIHLASKKSNTKNSNKINPNKINSNKINSNKTDCCYYKKAYKTLDGISVIKELEDVIFLYKPAGVLSQTDNTGQYSINEWLIGYLLENDFPLDFHKYKPSACNRLDRNTSGIVICAKTYLGSRVVSELIRTHRLKKYYLALVEGNISNRQDLEFDEDGFVTLKGFLVKNEKNNTVQIVKTKEKLPVSIAQEKSSKIYTRYQILEAKERYSLLYIQLITGKSHQIRSHFSSIGYPLAGDIKYGGHPLHSKKTQYLHAFKVIFPAMEKDEIGLSNLIITAEKPDYFHF